MEKHQFLEHVQIEAEVLELWVAEGWLVPGAGAQTFSDADVARARLIDDLKRDFGVNDQGVGIILDLIDQLHGVRGTLKRLLSSLQAQPPDLRERLTETLRSAMER